jgi:SPP1 gp7 family putative phage head morphogenesis protein
MAAPRKRPPPEPPADPAEFKEAIEAFRKRVPMSDAEWETLTTGEREYAFKVAQVAQADVVTQVYEAIDRAVTKGTTFEAFKASVAESLETSWGGEKPGRLETIFRTNVLGAYNEGRHAIFTAPAVKRARPYWRFDGIEDARQSSICEALSKAGGVLLPVDDPFWKSHVPPLHHNCRSTVVALSAEEAADEGVNDEAPDAEPDEGFGAAPGKEGLDWDPDLSVYPAAIADELGDRLK